MLSNIPKVTNQGTLLDSMQYVKSKWSWEFDVLFINEIWSGQMVKLKWRIINLKLYRRIIIPVCLSRIQIETMEGFRVWNRGRCLGSYLSLLLSVFLTNLVVAISWDCLYWQSGRLVSRHLKSNLSLRNCYWPEVFSNFFWSTISAVLMV